MKYKEGKLGRVFVLKFDHEDDFQKEITGFCKKENVRCGQVQFLGAIKGSEVVVGPKEPLVPPEPMWKEFNDGREVIGYGTIFWDDEGPRVHLHTMFSRGDDAFLGTHNGIAYYLLYNGILKDRSVDGGNILTTRTLRALPSFDGPKVIYGAGCRFGPQRLKRESITFKQTPYEIKSR